MLPTVPALLGMIDVYPGYPVANSVMLPMPTLWWLRPVRSAARVGEQSAVVWNWLYCSPLFAKRSRAGAGIGPPNVLGAPKPVSSVMMSRTFGAPLGAVTAFGKSGVDSLALRPMTPPNAGSGAGRIAAPPTGDEALCASAGVDSPMQLLTAAAMAIVSNRCLI